MSGLEVNETTTQSAQIDDWNIGADALSDFLLAVVGVNAVGVVATTLLLKGPPHASRHRPHQQSECANDCTAGDGRPAHLHCGHRVRQGRPDRGPRAQIWAPDRLFLGPLGLKYMH